ncbi:MAG: serine/threonine-protein kinase [Myxococcota bacterium]
MDEDVIEVALSDFHDLDVPVGAIIDQSYRVKRVVGRGGMGIVLLCVDEKLAREVAVKMIAPQTLSSDSRDLFLTEARAMAGVRHENVVQLFAYGDHEGVPYFAMEYVPGISVAEWLGRWDARTVDPPAVDEVLGILDQVCRGLSAIHAAGIVHADVKPGNILIGPSFRVAVTDFGLVRTLGQPDADDLIVGTPAYIAPEVVYSRQPVFDRGSDVYALAVTAYEMLTGRLPWPIENVGQLFDVHIRREALPPPSDVRPDLPRAFDPVFARALSREQDQRYESTDALRRAFLEARETVAAATTGVRVVIADDDEDFLQVARAAVDLAFPGAAIECVGDGHAAIRALDRKAASLAIVDLDMPGMNGVELTATIRTRPLLRDMPILVVSGTGGGADWRLLQQLGAAGFLVKPLDPYALVAMARRAIGAHIRPFASPGG